VDITVALFPEVSDGNAVWGPAELDSVPIFQGILSFILDGDEPLGMVGGVPAVLSEVLASSTGELWLEISIDGQLMSPRQLVLSVPYAALAANAVALGGIPASEVATLADLDALDASSVGAAAADHTHSAAAIVSGVLDSARVPTGTDTTKLPLAGGQLTGSVDMGFQPTTSFRFQPAATAPAACTPERVGYAYFDTSTSRLLICDGAEFVAAGAGAPQLDSAPDPFAFGNVVNAPVGTVITSAPVAVTGFDGPLTAQASAGLTIRRNGTGSFATTISGVAPNDTLEARVTAAATTSTTVSGTVALGDTTSTPWTVTTSSSLVGPNDYVLALGSTSTSVQGSYLNLYIQRANGTLQHLHNAGGFTAADVFRVKANPQGSFVAFDSNSDGPWLAQVVGDTVAAPFRPPGYHASGNGSGGNSSVCWTGTHFAFAGTTSPYLQWWSYSGANFNKLSSPTDPPQFGRACAFTPDGNYLAVGASGSPYVGLYSRSGNALSLLGLPSAQASDVYDVTWAGNNLLIGSTGSSGGASGIYLWTRSGNTISAAGQIYPQTLPNSHRWAAASPNGNYVVYSDTVALKDELRLVQVNLTNQTFSQASTYTFADSTGFRGGAWSPDGQFFAVARASSGSGFSVFSLSGNTLVLVGSVSGGSGNNTVTYVRKGP
jgi:WD40 repeat protein